MGRYQESGKPVGTSLRVVVRRLPDDGEMKPVLAFENRNTAGIRVGLHGEAETVTPELDQCRLVGQARLGEVE